MKTRENRPVVKAMFFDVDGTLLSFRTHTVPKSAMDALHLARECGVLLFLATGRHPSALMEHPQLGSFGFDGYVTMNGQYCFCSGEPGAVYHNPLPPADVGVMVDFLAHSDYACAFMEADRVYINRVNDVVRMVQKEIDEPLPPVTDLARALQNHVYQLCLYTPDCQVPEIILHLKGCAFTRWYSNGMDIVPRAGNKLEGVAHMLDHFGLTLTDAAAFGDSENDLELLRGIGYSVAMGNALDKVKAVADLVTGDIEEDGIYHAVLRLLG